MTAFWIALDMKAVHTSETSVYFNATLCYKLRKKDVIVKFPPVCPADHSFKVASQKEI
jgi:hypothetical protein